MGLINSLIHSEENLEERIFLREEFGRRGLNEIIIVSPFFFLFLTFSFGEGDTDAGGRR